MSSKETKENLATIFGLAESFSPGFLNSALPKKRQKPQKSESYQQQAIEAAKAKRDKRKQKRLKSL
jgi:hypothetical protein